MTLLILVYLDVTCDKKGSHGTVCGSHPGADSYKSFCSIRLLLRQIGIQPNIEATFWGTENKVEFFVKQA